LLSFERYVNAYGLPDVVHAHGILYGGYLAVHIGKRWQIPTVLTEHSSALMSGALRPDQRKIVRHTLHNTDKILAVGPALAQTLNQYCPECAIEVLGNIVDTEFFIPGDDEMPFESFIFASVAILELRKGFDILIRAFALAFRDEPVRLRIGGSGSQRHSLEVLALDSGIADQVDFLGTLSREEVRTLLRRSNVLVSSSHHETFGVTLIEAMALGKPVVATRSGGPEAIINATNGLLAPAGDIEALAAAMQQMVRDYERYDPR
jgi:glycosyltransferase involved in cell wall biosynthesis